MPQGDLSPWGFFCPHGRDGGAPVNGAIAGGWLGKDWVPGSDQLRWKGSGYSGYKASEHVRKTPIPALAPVHTPLPHSQTLSSSLSLFSH